MPVITDNSGGIVPPPKGEYPTCGGWMYDGNGLVASAMRKVAARLTEELDNRTMTALDVADVLLEVAREIDGPDSTEPQ